MTEDELDLLASAYVDGEATSEEIALVEGDPELLARVAELQAVSEQLSTPPPIDAVLKQQHLAAAMAEFSNLTGGGNPAGADSAVVDSAGAASAAAGPSTTSSVPSLAEKRRDREARKAQRSMPRSMPRWMPAAAAFILIGGGVIFLAGRGGDDDLTEAATGALDAASEERGEFQDFASDDASDAAGSRLAAESDAMDESMEESAFDGSGDSEAMADDAETAEILPEAEDAAEAEVVPDVDDDSDDGASTTTAVESTTTTSTSGGFFPQEPVAQYASVPDIDGIFVDLPAPRGELELSRCGFELDGELVDLEITGYLPIEIAGAPAEVFAVLTQDGSDSAIIVDEACETLAAG